MKKLMLVASTLVIGTTGPAFAAGDETGGGITTPESSLMTTASYSEPAAAPEELTLMEYFLRLLAEWREQNHE